MSLFMITAALCGVPSFPGRSSRPSSELRRSASFLLTLQGLFRTHQRSHAWPGLGCACRLPSLANKKLRKIMLQGLSRSGRVA